MMIIFFEFDLTIFNEKVLDKVSTVLPDFETIIKSTFEKLFSFFKLSIISSLRSLKKYTFFFYFFLKKIIDSFRT